MAQAARLNLRMQKELKLLLTDPPPGVSLVPSDNEGSSISCLSVMEARIAGPEGTAYAGGVFTIRIQIPERYPFQPPNVTFATPIYHPNIDNGGRICLDILNLPPKGAWRPSLNISTVLTSIGLLLSEPNPDDGLMCDTSREYKYNRQVFDQKAQSWTEKYAKADFCRSKIDACITAMSEDTTVSKLSEKAAEDPIPETDACRKKIRIVGAKLSLRPVAEKSYGVDQENITQTGFLSLPHSQNATGASSTALDQVADGCGHPMQNHASQTSNVEPEKWAQVPETVEAAIVSDSEESDVEIERPRRARLSLLRRQIVVEGRRSRQR